MDGTIPLPPPQTSDEPMTDAPTTHPYTVNPPDDNDSDWEYEYHPTETVTHYVVLDMTSSQPMGPHQRRPRTGNDTPPPQQPPSSPAPLPSSPNTPPPSSPPPLPQIQLKNLHTPTPHLLYNDILYHCSWTQPLGTDVLLAPARPASPSTSPPPSPPTKPQDPNVDILGLSRIKLMARPIKHIPPTDSAVVEPPQRTEARRPATTGRPVIERRERQVAFLERLAAVKRAKGEGDEVRMAGWKPGEDPRGRGRRARGRRGGRGRGGLARRVGDVDLDNDDGGEHGERRVRWGDDVAVGVEEARALVERAEEEEARRREAVGDEEILQGGEEDEEVEEEEEEEEEQGMEEIFTEGEQELDMAVTGEEDAADDDEMGDAEEAAEIATDAEAQHNDGADVLRRER